MICRSCSAPVEAVFADLGTAPLSNAFLRAQDLERPEPRYPLLARVCARCFLVQLPAVETPQAIFQDYAYFSSFSESWLAHARRYCDSMQRRLGLGSHSLVVEVASNDGYLLANFLDASIPVLGIEPAENVAAVARERGIETISTFFGAEAARELVRQGRQADLLIANNVLAHVPDINDFVEGLSLALKEEGLLTAEFPHLLQLIKGNQFDTIYHEHFSYLALGTVQLLFERHGLRIVEVEELSTHGGSLRVHARHAGSSYATDGSIPELLARERAFGLQGLDVYLGFAEQVRESRRALREFAVTAKHEGRTLAAYGAPAKGNTLLNYCDIGRDLIDYTVDRSPHKQGLFLPGTHIPIYAPQRIFETRPDYVLILPWNLRDEIAEQMEGISEWGGRFVVPIPHVEVFP